MKFRFILFFLSFISFSSLSLAQTSDPPSGSGTSGDPYLISNLNELWTVSFNPQIYSWGDYYKQTANIDASSTSGWNSGAGFSPIGNSGTKFTGQYDGNGFTITGLTIDRSSTDYIGLFGYTDNATLIDITLINVDLTGEDKVGALVGLAANGTDITNSSSSGTILATRSSAGGLVGENQNSTITHSYSSANVTATAIDPGNSSAGGLVGWSNGGKVISSYATGTATGETAGGLVGFVLYINSTLNASITDSYATGAATGTVFEGGLVGENRNGNAPITTSYFNTTTGGPDNSIGTDLTTAQMRLSSSFSGFDFTNDWEQVDGIHFPVLQDNTQDPLPGVPDFAGGNGTSGSPYQISSAEQLYIIRYDLDAYYILNQNIDLNTPTSSGGIFWNDGEGWDPIGSSFSNSFQGNFDGNGYTIDGLFINRPSESYLGLFGAATSNARIENVGLTDVNITGNSYVGGITGYLSYSPSIITHTFVTGNVSGASYVGGIAGSAASTAKIENSYSRVTATASSSTVGGIVGLLSFSGQINHTYVYGSASGSSNVGAIVGQTAGESALTNSYWNTEKTTLTTAVGSGSTIGTTGLTTLEMYSADSFSGFDFTNTWQNNAPTAFPSLKNITQSPAPGFGLIFVQSVGSLNLDGTDDYLSIPNNAVFNDITTFTTEGWFYFESSGRQGLFEKHESPSSGWWVDFNTDISVAFVTSGGVISANSITNPQLNTWHHIAVTYDGSDIKIYLDGTDVSGTVSGTGSGAILNNTREIRIGDLNWTTAHLDGRVDDVRFWNDVRTQDEIRMNMFQSISGSEAGLIGYWNMNLADADTVADVTSNDNDATLTGGASIGSKGAPNGTLITGDAGWRMLTAPVSGASYGELLDTLWTQGFTGADVTNGTSNVYTWSESTRSFTSISNATEVPSAGSGFLVYVFSDDDFDGTPDDFPKLIRTDSTQNVGNITPSLSYTDSGTPADNGWNLLGNPYGSTIDWDASGGFSRSNLDASFYVWSDSANSGAGDYLSWNGSTGTLGGGEIAPWQGFWVKASTTNPSISLFDSTRTTGGILRKVAVTPQLTLTLNGAEMNSNTILMFSNEAITDKDPLDAYKLQSLNTDYLSLFTQLEDGSGLDINAIPFDLEGEVSIPIGFDGSDLSGDYTLNWNPQALPEDMAMVLMDTDTGTEVDLTKASSYRFELDGKAKAVQTQDIASPRDIASPKQAINAPSHSVFSPKVMKAKTAATRFVIKVNASTSVTNEPGSDLPAVVELDQNYPNPFNPSTTINFAVPEQANVQLVVFDMLGRKVAELLNEPRSPGRYSITFDASRLASGLYLYQLRVGNDVITRKMTLIK